MRCLKTTITNWVTVILILLISGSAGVHLAQDNTIKPDMINGAMIFTEHCATCHGAIGAGDGERVLSGEISAIEDFTNPLHIEGQTPRDYFTIIANGIADGDMPAWADELSDVDRWSVAMFTYTRHYTAAQINLGAQIYANECATCHGETGLGDGEEMPESSRSDGDLTDFSNLNTLSDQHLLNIVAEGAGDDMPAFAETLSLDEQQAVIAYTRTLSLNNAIAYEEEPEMLQPVTGQITGQLIPMSADVTLLPNTPITLHIIDSDFNEETFSVAANTNGNFTFNNIAIAQDYLYFITTTYKGRQFSSTITQGSVSDPFINFPVAIYNITDDASVISISTILTQIDTREGAPNMLQVNQFFRFANNSQQTFSTDKQLGDGRFISLEIPFPIGAIPLGLEDNAAYVFDEQTFTLLDTRPVMPGDSHDLQITYLMPYRQGASIDYPVNYATDASFNLLIDTDKISLSSAQIDDAGTQTLGSKIYNLYSGTVILNAGEFIKYELTGGHAPLIETNDEQSSNSKFVVIAIIAILIIATIAIIIITRPKTNHINIITRQLKQLEEQHNQGKINHDLYRHRQKELRARLKELTGEDT